MELIVAVQIHWNCLKKAVIITGFIVISNITKHYERLANANRPCDCSVLFLRPKSLLRSCPHSILDMT